MIKRIGIYYDPRKRKPWVVRWFGEFDPNTEKECRYSRSFELKRDAEAFQAEQAAAFSRGRKRDKPKEIGLKDFCTEWLKVRKSELRPTTMLLYEMTFKRVIEYFGADCYLSQISPRLAAKFISELRPIRGENLSAWSRHRELRHCKTIFEVAVTWELIGQNPFKNIKSPKLVTKRWHYIRLNEYLMLIERAPTLYWKAFYALAYTAGLRFGELFSLTWADVDFDSGEVKVQSRPGSPAMPEFYVKDYETRRIPLSKHTLNILTELHNEAPEGVPYILLDEKKYRTVVAKWQRYRAAGKPWLNVDIINNVLRDFKRHVRLADIKVNGSLSIHTLRKSCIQNWANELPINVVKELAGHSSIITTQKYYLQVDEYHRTKAAEIIDNLLAQREIALILTPNRKKMTPN